jgi:hypothetical protein
MTREKKQSVRNIVFCFALLSFGFTLLSVSGTGAPKNMLDQFKWKNRIILLTASTALDQQLAQQLELLSGKNDGLDDRDLIIIQLLSDSSSYIEGEVLSQKHAAEIRSRFETSKLGFEILLIGKDGTVKLRSEKPVSSDQLFALIDSMPMRQREMRND